MPKCWTLWIDLVVFSIFTAEWVVSYSYDSVWMGVREEGDEASIGWGCRQLSPNLVQFSLYNALFYVPLGKEL